MKKKQTQKELNARARARIGEARMMLLQFGDQLELAERIDAVLVEAIKHLGGTGRARTEILDAALGNRDAYVKRYLTKEEKQLILDSKEQK